MMISAGLPGFNSVERKSCTSRTGMLVPSPRRILALASGRREASLWLRDRPVIHDHRAQVMGASTRSATTNRHRATSRRYDFRRERVLVEISYACFEIRARVLIADDGAISGRAPLSGVSAFAPP